MSFDSYDVHHQQLCHHCIERHLGLTYASWFRKSQLCFQIVECTTFCGFCVYICCLQLFSYWVTDNCHVCCL